MVSFNPRSGFILETFYMRYPQSMSSLHLLGIFSFQNDSNLPAVEAISFSYYSKFTEIWPFFKRHPCPAFLKYALQVSYPVNLYSKHSNHTIIKINICRGCTNLKHSQTNIDNFGKMFLYYRIDSLIITLLLP